MATLGYHASHEQFDPGELNALVQRAEAAGFEAAMCSDHFHPWTQAQGQSGHAWVWLGAAMQATRLPMGVVTVPGPRYHPAVLAQAAATLARMYAGRFWLCLGSGEALNERITGEAWPLKDLRNARLEEAVHLIRALWAGEEVTHRGHFTVERARLYTRPDAPVPIYAAALSPETARWAARWADGLITASQPRERLARIVEAFRAGGGEGKPMALQVKLAYAETDDAALDGAFDQWRALMLPSPVLAELATPAEFEQASQHVRREDVAEHLRISADPEAHLAWLRQDLALGFSKLMLHNVTRDQRRFIDDFGRHVLPALRRAR
jgi:probable non-F420 flavinoid oxidoreductase